MRYQCDDKWDTVVSFDDPVIDEDITIACKKYKYTFADYLADLEQDCRSKQKQIVEDFDNEKDFKKILL